MSEEPSTVLRDIWRAHPQSVAELAETFGVRGHGKACKAMRHITFAGADDEPVGEDLRAAWRATLARDGKLRDGHGVRDLVTGQHLDRHHDRHLDRRP